jgi:hypothetical protein
MSVWDDFIGFFALVATIALLCSALFWGLASGALAINARSKRPMLHLFLGALLHFIWFFVVGILAIIALAKGKTRTVEVASNQNQPTNPVAPDLNKGFEEW